MKEKMKKIMSLKVVILCALLSIPTVGQAMTSLQPGIDNGESTTLTVDRETSVYAVDVQPGDMPVNASSVQFRAFTDDGTEVDVTGKLGALPSSSENDCADTGDNANCSIRDAGPGTYYFEVTSETDNQPVTVYAAYDSPASSHGALHVCQSGAAKNRLCDKFGKPVQLRGMGTHGVNWFPWGTGPWGAGSDCYNTDTMDILARDWKVDVLRVSMYPSSITEGILGYPGRQYKQNADAYHAMVETFIDEAIARDLYVVVDWHMLWPVDPQHNEYVGLFDAGKAPAGCETLSKVECYFRHFAQKYGSTPNVIFEIANEPSNEYFSCEADNGCNCFCGDPGGEFTTDPDCTPEQKAGKCKEGDNFVKKETTWESADKTTGLKPYSDKMVRFIRDNGGNNVVIVPTRDWCTMGMSAKFWDKPEQGVGEILGAMVTDSNVLYSVHQYAMNQYGSDHYREALTYAAEPGANGSRLPVFVSEFGSQDVEGNQYPEDKFKPLADEYIRLMNRYGTSFTTWNFSDDSNEQGAESNAVWLPGKCGSIVNDGVYKEKVEDYSWYQHLSPSGKYIVQKLRELPVTANIQLQEGSEIRDEAFVANGQTITPLLSLASGVLKGEPADWWIVYSFKSAQTGATSWKYFSLGNATTPAQWLPTTLSTLSRTYGGGLLNLEQYPTALPNLSEKGVYTFYLGVDLTKNGSLDMNNIAVDSIKVTVQN